MKDKPFQIRTKDEHGKPKTGWRTVYAKSEKEAVLEDAINLHGHGKWDITRLRKK